MYQTQPRADALVLFGASGDLPYEPQTWGPPEAAALAAEPEARHEPT